MIFSFIYTFNNDLVITAEGGFNNTINEQLERSRNITGFVKYCLSIDLNPVFTYSAEEVNKFSLMGLNNKEGERVPFADFSSLIKEYSINVKPE